MTFILLFGIVSLFSDMTHEAASSIRGAYFSLLGASASAIGFVSGLGELIGYSMRYVFGRIADKTKQYWPMVIIGYLLDILAVPALALVGENGWIWACALLLVQRFGKALKKPAKNTIVSFAASLEGPGKSFAVHELMDQIGAFLGPVFFYLIMLFKTSGTVFETYSLCLALTVIPGLITILFLFITKKKFPNPEQFEPEAKVYIPVGSSKVFVFYIIGISLFSFGFIDYNLIVMHVSNTFGQLAEGVEEFSSIVSSGSLPLLYALAMLVDAVSALIFGYLYDKKGIRVLMLSTLIAAPFSALVFAGRTVGAVIAGIVLWGIGMGAQESVLKAAVSTIVPKASRATGYGIFELFCGIFWFLGSTLLGILYEKSLPWLIIVSIATQILAIPMFYLSARQFDKKEIS